MDYRPRSASAGQKEMNLSFQRIGRNAFLWLLRSKLLSERLGTGGRQKILPMPATEILKDRFLVLRKRNEKSYQTEI